MKALIPLLVFAGLIALAVRATLRQLRDDPFAQGEAAPAGIVADVDANGKFQKVETGVEDMRRTWHPVRFPSGWESRCGGFPEEKAYSDTSMLQRRDWCMKHCESAWRVEVARGNAPVFWFESHRDATEFSFAWFPFKCS